MNSLPERFRRCLDPKVMQDVLSTCLLESASTTAMVLSCRIENVRYKTYRRVESRHRAFVSAVYRISLKEGLAATREVLYAGWCYLGKRAEDEFARLSASAQESVYLVSELGLLLRPLTRDAGMPWLQELTSVESAKALGVAGLTQTGAFDVEVVNYRPGVRCSLRYLPHNGTDTGVFVKTFAEPEAGPLHERIERIREHTVDDAFLIPQIRCLDTARNAVWFEHMAGTPLQPDAMGMQDIVRVGRSLATFHRLRVPDVPVLAHADYRAELTKKIEKLTDLLPQFGLSLAILRQTAMVLPEPQVNTLVHGDFHLQQLSMVGSRIALFDYDELQCGDPCLDLANILADLINDFPLVIAERWQDGLLAGYGQLSTWIPDAAQLSNHLAMRLLTRAYRAYIQQRDDLVPRMARLIAIARWFAERSMTSQARLASNGQQYPHSLYL